jgi:hypothetical protein
MMKSCRYCCSARVICPHAYFGALIAHLFVPIHRKVLTLSANTNAKITFQDKSITSLVIVGGGQNYIPGDVSVSGGGGSTFSATFTVDESGSINFITISDYGKQYTSTPSSVNVLYRGTALLQASCPKNPTRSDLVLISIDALHQLEVVVKDFNGCIFCC